MRRHIVRNLMIGVALLATAGALLPLRTRELRSRARPSGAYEESVRRINAMRAVEQPLVTEFGGTVLMAHGGHAPKVAVLLHGLTATPHQMQLLGDQLYERGYDVFIPRMPMHGERGRTGWRSIGRKCVMSSSRRRRLPWPACRAHSRIRRCRRWRGCRT